MKHDRVMRFCGVVLVICVAGMLVGIGGMIESWVAGGRAEGTGPAPGRWIHVAAYTWAMQVPDGWVVMHDSAWSYGESMCFVPDAEHAWLEAK